MNISRAILTPAEMYRADALAMAAGVSEGTLIERAGLKVAEEIVRRYGARPTLVMCGPGNNGKDGQVIARVLTSWGWPVTIGMDITGAALIVDAIYGAGLNRDFDRAVAAKVNGAGLPVVAIDVPSGLDGFTGWPRGAAIQADLTITFVRKKPAHLLYPGRELCGELVVADIGIGDEMVTATASRLWENARPLLPVISPDTHKFRKGHVVVLSGDRLHSGAARLSAWAAQRAGAGLVSLVGSDDALRVHAAHVSSIMLKQVETPGDFSVLLGDRRITAACIGPAAGVGVATREFVLAALKAECAAVLDADALTSFEGQKATLFKAIAERRAVTVLTPHRGEFRRLFNDIDVTSQSKVEAARHAATTSGAVVLYKGADTVIAAPDGRAVINGNGTPRLAIAGSGDVLAGVITGLLAEGVEGFEAACAAAWLHAHAANTSSRDCITAEDLIDSLEQ